MRRVKYYLARLRSLDVANMRRVAREIAARIGRTRLGVLLDMVRCSIRYGAGYLDYEEYEFYLLNARERATFMTSTHFDRIAARYNEPTRRSSTRASTGSSAGTGSTCAPRRPSSSPTSCGATRSS